MGSEMCIRDRSTTGGESGASGKALVVQFVCELCSAPFPLTQDARFAQVGQAWVAIGGQSLCSRRHLQGVWRMLPYANQVDSPLMRIVPEPGFARTPRPARQC